MKKRTERYWDVPADVDRDDEGRPIDKNGKLINKRTRMVENLEWIAPDGTIYRSPQNAEEAEGASAILDRRRRREEGE